MNEVVLSETTQAIVNVVFGVCLGAVTCLIALASRNTDERRIRDKIRESSHKGRELAQRQWGLILATYGLVGIMIATVQFSPISMRWWWFLGSLMAVMMLAQSHVRGVVKRGSVRKSERGRNEPASGDRDDGST